MDCETTREKLYELLFDLLEGDELRAITEHLERCEECRAALEAARRECELLQQWTPPSPPADLAECTIAAVRARAGEGGPAASGREPGAIIPIERDIPWLYSSRFWRIAAGVLVVIAVGVLGNVWRIARMQADPQEAFVFGQWSVTPGGPAVWRVQVRNGENDRPIPDAEVRAELLDEGRHVVWASIGESDAFGMVAFEALVPDDLDEGDYTLRVQTRSDVGRGTVEQTVRVDRSFRVMVSTDKPLYQPGQTIHIRSLSLATDDLRPAGGRDAVIEVRDAKGNMVYRKALRTSDFGIAAGDFVLADQVNEGTYTVRAAVGDTESERTVSVERYRLPKFRIDVACDRPYYAPGGVVVCDVRAAYTFGEPVAGASVTVEAQEYVTDFSTFATADGRTDAEGRAHFDVPLKGYFVGSERSHDDAVVSLKVTVRDGAGHELVRTHELTVTTEPLKVELFPESGTLVQGVENVLYVVTAYADGRPARATLTLGKETERVETSDAGIARVKVTPDSAAMQLTVAAEDAEGLRTRVTRKLRVGESADGILLRTDRAVYRTGETAAVTVLTPAERARVFLDVVKGGRTMLMKAIDVEDGRGELALDLPHDLFGTLQIHAWRILPRGDMAADTRVVQVNRAEGLGIAAELDKETYRPGESALLKLAVTDRDGDPVQAALSLSAVDEAVFALSEMRPGLERVYFALQGELLQPRYELCVHPGMVPERIVDLEEEPDPELEEAEVMLFSAAEGTDPPARAQGATFEERREAVAAMKARQSRFLQRAAWLSPAGVSLLLLGPIILLGAWKVVAPRRDFSVPSEDADCLRRTTLRMAVILVGMGLVLPAAVFPIVAAVTDSLVLGALLAAVGAVPAYVLAGVWVRKARRLPIATALPLTRKALALLPGACCIAVVGMAVVFVACEEMDILDPTAATAVLFTLLGAYVLAAVAATEAGDISAQRLGRARRMVRPVLTLVVVAFLGLIVMGSLNTAGGDAGNAMGDVAYGLGGGLWLPMADGVPCATAEAAPLDVAQGLAEANGEEGAVSGRTPRIRRYFPETLLWRPELITDEGGRAQLTVPLADSITTWRLAMSAVSLAGELGAATRGLRVFQDFFVDVDLPVELTQHDSLSVPVAVYNYLDRPQDVRIELSPAPWFDLSGEAVRHLRVGPREVTAAYFHVTALRPGVHAVTVRASGEGLSDAVERAVRVRPDGREVVQTVSGILGRGAKCELLIPPEAIDGGSDLLVKVYPGAFSQVVEGLDGVFRMPYGCFEQTSSITYPNVLVLDYMRRTKQIQPDVEMKALGFVNTGYQRLLSFEVEGGGFEWFGQAPAHVVLTAYGLMEFQDMAGVFEVDPAIIERTRAWLIDRQAGDGSWAPVEGGIPEGAINAFQGARLRTTAYVTWALGQAAPADALDYIESRAADATDAYTLALCTNALLAGKRAAAARRLVKPLMALAVTEGELLHWPSDAAGLTYSRGGVLDVETTALAVMALAGLHEGAAELQKAIAWLISKKDAAGTWHSTQATVLAMRALLAGVGRQGDVEEAMNVTVSVGGDIAEKLTVTPETADVYRLISLREHVREGRNRVELAADRESGLAWQVVATHHVPWEQAEMRPAEAEISIDVRYDTTELTTSDTLNCHVTVESHRDTLAPMLIVDLGVPPGFDVLPDAFAEMKSRGALDRYSVSGPQVILYFRGLTRGEPIRFTWQMKARFPVKVKTPASSAYLYYEPEVRAVAAPVQLTVRQ